MDEINLMKRFESVGEAMLFDREYREEASKNKIAFGIRYLDVALGGILTNDLILIGAKPGAGKTEIATSIAINAIEQGKRVAGFFLEAERHEISSRIKYRAVSDYYWSSTEFTVTRATRRLNYPDWYEGKFNDLLKEHEDKISTELRGKFKYFLARYKVGDFSAKDLRREIMLIKDSADLIIVDHLHYIDLDGDVSENKAMSELIKTMRDLSLVVGKPIIMIAHLRKSDERMKKIMPTLEDFRGTGDIGGVVTKAILIAPAYDKQDECSPTQYATYIQAAKYRREGSRTRFVALCKFDNRTNAYDQSYALGYLYRSKGDQVWRLLPDDKVPYWHTDKQPAKPSNIFDPSEKLPDQAPLFEEPEGDSNDVDDTVPF